MRLLDDLFQMGGGYVLDFTNRTFAEFLHEELGINMMTLGTMPTARAKPSGFASF